MGWAGPQPAQRPGGQSLLGVLTAQQAAGQAGCIGVPEGSGGSDLTHGCLQTLTGA